MIKAKKERNTTKKHKSYYVKDIRLCHMKVINHRTNYKQWHKWSASVKRVMVRNGGNQWQLTQQTPILHTENFYSRSRVCAFFEYLVVEHIAKIFSLYASQVVNLILHETLPGLKHDIPHKSSHLHLFRLPLQSALTLHCFRHFLPASISSLLAGQSTPLDAFTAKVE